jgi:4-diphosphocytidyl-2C-methyl-D-erythritol kinase
MPFVGNPRPSLAGGKSCELWDLEGAFEPLKGTQRRALFQVRRELMSASMWMSGSGAACIFFC